MALVRPFPQIKTQNLILRLPELNDTSEIIRYFKENESHLSPFDPKKPDDFYTEDFGKVRMRLPSNLSHSELEWSRVVIL